ncbi:MAG: hypothetical protein IJH65_03595 [Methanobrevibacter sp.]|nr:hypothetical protein [Methanobrevibacter sp.]
MEYKTCEQYVLAELENVKNELETVKDAYAGVLNQFVTVKDKFEKLCDLLREITTVYHLENNYDYISFNYLWDNTPQFDDFVEIVKSLKVENK